MELSQFVESMQEKRLRVSRKMILREAGCIFDHLQAEGKIPADKTFKQSQGFCQRFMKRNQFTLRRHTTVCQKVPEDYLDKIVSFIMHIRRQRKAIQYSQIFGTDETPCWFEVIAANTVEKVGSPEVAVKSTGHEKMRCTVMLTARADGRKEKPFVVLKRVRKMPELEKKFPKLVIDYTRNGWMNQENTLTYLDKIIGGFNFGSRRLLCWDAFRCHIDSATKVKLSNMKIDTAVIPGGCTKYLQPADVSWNKSFKARLQDLYDKWMTNGQQEYTSGGNMKAPSLEIVCGWINSSWYSIPEQLIIDSFKYCGISVDVTGSEDDMISCLKSGQPCEKGLALLKEKTAELNAMEDFGLDELQEIEDPNYQEQDQDVEQEEENCGVIIDTSDDELEMNNDIPSDDEEEF